MKYRRRLGLDVWGDGKIVLDDLVAERRECAALYRDAVAGCPWIKPQHVPDGWTHDYWAYAVALEHADLWHPFADAVERHGGTRPFAAWRLNYQEPTFRHLVKQQGSTWYDDNGQLCQEVCPVAEDLQPRIVAGQTNDLASAQRNADAWHAAIYELNGVPA
jgi:dTDP-4-amino-4,6-dideoxygalactose transaminase